MQVNVVFQFWFQKLIQLAYNWQYQLRFYNDIMLKLLVLVRLIEYPVSYTRCHWRLQNANFKFEIFQLLLKYLLAFQSIKLVTYTVIGFSKE